MMMAPKPPRNRSLAKTLVTNVHELPFAPADARVFVSVAEAGSFARAAAMHSMSPSAVSKTIRRLEEALGTRLLTRTTRALHLTDEGIRFHELTAQAFELMAAAVEEAQSTTRAVRGLVRIGMPPLFGTYLMPRVIAELQVEHPDLAIEIVSTMVVSDLVDRGLDLVIAVGELPPSSFLTRPLGWGQFVVVASAAYLKAHREPKVASDLDGHACIGYVAPDGRVVPWMFAGNTMLPIEPSIRSDDMHHIAAMAAAGLGIAQLPLFVVTQDIEVGRLRRLLPRAEPAVKLASIVFPSTRTMPRRVRVVVDHLAERATPLSGTTRRRA